MKIIGIDLGGTKILGVRSDEEGKVQARALRPTEAARGLDAVLYRITDTIRELIPPEGVDAIGVGVPGPLDAAKGMVYEPANLPGWKDVPLRELLYARSGMPREIPLVLVNDANAAALAEYSFGAGSEKVTGRKLQHLVYLTISTGIGGGVISDGKLLLGATGMAAELGHVSIDFAGPRCYCGSIGCLEILASGPALAREASVVIASRRATRMAELVGGDARKVTAEVVVKAAQEGDAQACALMEREGLLVGVGVVNCIHTFNPELVVLGGGVSNAGDLLFKPVRATVEARVMPAYKGTFDIVPAALGGTSGALGAVAAALAASRKAEGGGYG
ncbi:MAG: ROK family protein [Chloroflexi bacterium]|nr:ROK family protein [Chloroflexota bacterium]